MVRLVFLIYVISVMLSFGYNYKLKRNGLTGIPYKQCFNPVKMFSVLYGMLLSILIPQHILEQLVVRVYDEDCRNECLNGNGGRCVSCGCNTYMKMMSPFEKDSKDRWGKIIFNKEEYNKFRNDYPIKITVKWLNSKN